MRAVKIQLSCQSASQRLGQAGGALSERQLPHSGQRDPMPGVELRRAPVEHRVVGIQIPEVVVVVAVVAEGRAQVVVCAAERVLRRQLQAGFGQLPQIEAKGDTVVLRLSTIAAGVERGEPRVRPRGRGAGAGVDQSGAGLVRIREVVQLAAARSGVFNAAGQRPTDLLLQRQAVEVRIRCLDVLIDVAQAAARDGLGDTGDTAERAGVVDEDRHRRDVEACVDGGDQVLRWVEQHVIGDVAEVALVAHSVTAAHAGAAVAGDVPCESDTRSPVVPVGLPQRPDWAVTRGQRRAARDAANDLGRAARAHRHVRISVVEVGVELRVALGLRTVVLIADAEIHGHAVADAPVVVRIERELVVGVEAGEAGQADRRDVGAAGIPFGVDRGLEPREAALHEVVERRKRGGGQVEGLDCVRICAKRAVVRDVDVGTAESQIVLATDPGLVLIELQKLLRPAERNRVARDSTADNPGTRCRTPWSETGVVGFM